MKFNHLNVPTHWQNYWSRYPEGHTILEALISWVSQVDSMVDNQNKLNDNVEQFRTEIDDFVKHFDERLQDEVIQTLSDWQDSGFIDVVISSALQWELDEYKATNEQDKLSINQQLDQKAPLTTVNGILERLEHDLEKYPLYYVDTPVIEGDESTRLELAMKKAVLERRTLVMPPYTIEINRPLTINANSVDLVIAGEGSGQYRAKSKILWRGGAGILFTFTGVTNIIFKDIEISGYDSATDQRLFAMSSVGIKADGSLLMDNVNFNGFETLAEWKGGYYHTFQNCFIRYTLNGFYRFNANNVTFENCKIMNIGQLMSVAGGTGPISVTNCSIERFTKSVFSQAAGVTPAISITGTYIENYPNTIAREELEAGYFYSPSFIYGFTNVTLLGNTIFINGIGRFIYSTAVSRQVTSLGNTIKFAPTMSDHQHYLYTTSSLEVLHMVDHGIGDLTGHGTDTPAYISTTAHIRKIAGATRVYDAYNKVMLNPSASSTSNRPTQALYTGLTLFDSTLGKPIWWDGTNWIDSGGDVV